MGVTLLALTVAKGLAETRAHGAAIDGRRHKAPVANGLYRGVDECARRPANELS